MPPVVLETQHALTDFVGREIALTEWLTITQDRIDRFAEATQDRQWIHVDRERAQRESPYGTTIAHGFLTLSLLSFFMKQVDRKSTRLNSSHLVISYAVFCLKKKKDRVRGVRSGVHCNGDVHGG